MIYVYIKSTEDIAVFYETIHALYIPDTEVFSCSENRRSFRKLNDIKTKCSREDILIIGSVNSLGLNSADIANQLQWFIDNSIMLVICDVNTTYIFGVSQPMNKAVLGTILQSILENDGKIVKMTGSRRRNSGRNRAEFPDEWEELFEQWENKHITSSEFLERSKLKKATFYNLITEYRRLREISNQFMYGFSKHA